jgi:hypothetical protein
MSSKPISTQKEFHAIIKALKAKHIDGKTRMEARSAIDIELLRNMYDYIKRRSEVESEYARRMEIIEKQFSVKKAVKKSRSNQELNEVVAPVARCHRL